MAGNTILVVKWRRGSLFKTTFSHLGVEDATILLVSEFVPIIAEKDIIAINSLLHLSICHSLIKPILLVHVPTRAKLACGWILFIRTYKRLSRVAILMELRSCMNTSHLLWTYLRESLWIVGFKSWRISWSILIWWRGERRNEWLHLSSLSIGDSLDAWDLSLVSLVLLSLSWAHHSAWTARLRTTINSWILTLQVLCFISCISMLSIAHLSIDITISRREESCSYVTMRAFIWVHISQISSSRSTLSHIVRFLISHVWINILHWKVIGFWLCWLLDSISIISAK